MVTEQQLREDCDRWIGAMNDHDAERMDRLVEEMYTADFVRHPGAASRPRGHEGYKQMVRSILQHHPNLHITLRDAFAAGDKAAIRCDLLLTDQATGQPTQRLDLLIQRYEGRKVAEEWELLGSLDPE